MRRKRSKVRVGQEEASAHGAGRGIGGDQADSEIGCKQSLGTVELLNAKALVCVGRVEISSIPVFQATPSPQKTKPASLPTYAHRSSALNHTHRTAPREKGKLVDRSNRPPGMPAETHIVA